MSGIINENGPTLREAFEEFRASRDYWSHPLSVRSRFQQVASWWPNRDADFSLTKVNATFARMQRDRAALAQGWRTGNFALILLQTLVARAVETGVLPTNRVRLVPKLPPIRQPPNRNRRSIRPHRHRAFAIPDSKKTENSAT